MPDTASVTWRQSLSDMRWRVSVFLLSCVGAGVVAGVMWAFFGVKPEYTLNDDLEASMGERQLADIFASDALFTVLLAVAGLAIGVACWILFQRNGWWVCALAVIGAGIAGLVAWQVGLLVTPDDFEARLASAVGGAGVPVDLQLRSMAALLVAPFTAITPVMLLAAFAPEPREPSPVIELETQPDTDV